MIESDPITSEAIATVAELLAAAYRRYLAANRLETASEAVNGELDNDRAKSPHAQKTNHANHKRQGSTCTD